MKNISGIHSITLGWEFFLRNALDYCFNPIFQGLKFSKYNKMDTKSSFFRIVFYDLKVQFGKEFGRDF